ncbi:MAG: tartrate-resistant acid phosphatase type 5 family protein [Capnocytophaga sp.]|nr:tartrate-resistant acid phosphatase type 5 family protein [Capnocytophaga sp.]
MRRTILMSVALLVAGVLSAQRAVYTQTPSNPNLVSYKVKDAFTFLVLGDWGRNGEFYQTPVAEQMARASKTLDADIVVSTGDNFYPNGVRSVQDPQWWQSYENIYGNFYLNIPWLVSLGNHDYYGNYEAQIEYSGISRRWIMPDKYFTQTYTLKSGKKILFIVIDTNPFVQKYQNYKEMIGENVKKQDTQAQLAWLENQLKTKEKEVQWVFVVGHHPLYSGGKRIAEPETEDIRKVFEPIFQKYSVDAYFCGHEHDLQVIQPKGIKTVQYLSGAGSEIRPTGKREGTRYAVSDGGFMSVSVTDKLVKTTIINANGEALYSEEIKK